MSPEIMAIEHVESLEHSTTASSGKSKKGPMYGRGAQVKNDGMATFAPSFFLFSQFVYYVCFRHVQT